MNYPKIDELGKILASLKETYEIILFGSAVEGAMRPKYNIDIAVLSRNQNQKSNIDLQKELLGKFPLKFDLRIFELLPIYIQISIVQNYKVIFVNHIRCRFCSSNFKYSRYNIKGRGKCWL